MQHKTVLLIDESLNQLFLTKAQLQRHSASMDVDVARSHEEGLEKLRVRKYDCVIRSVEPGNKTEGLALSQTLQSLKIETPVILLSNDENIQPEESKGALLVHRDSENNFVSNLTTTIGRIISEDDLARQEEARITTIHRLQATLAQYEAAFDSSDSLMMILSPDGLTVERCTDSLEKMFRPESYGEDQFRRIPLVMLIAQKDRQRMRSFIKNVISNNKTTDIFDFAMPGGKTVKLKILGKPVLQGDHVTALILKAESVKNRL